MSKVEVKNDPDINIAEGGDPVVVLSPDDLEVIVTGEQGPPGLPGPPGGASTIPGPPGAPGNTILYGPSNPTGTAGRDGDFYINTTTNFIFGPKVSGSWPGGISLVGPQGAQGAQGVQGVQGVPGTPGNTVLYGATDPAAGTGVNGNFYINTTTHFMFGPKAAGAWPSGTSLIGPQGIQGPPGTQGPQGIQGEPGVDGAGSPATVAPLMDGVAAVGTSMQFARQDHVHPSDTAHVAKAGDTMTGPLTLPGDPAVALHAATKGYVDGRTSIAAAPFDAMAYNGMQVNGGGEVSQELAQNGMTGGGFFVDGWQGVKTGTMTVSFQQAGTVFTGFPNQLFVSIGTPQASLGAGDSVIIYQNIEGTRAARLAWGTANAQPITIGFWSSHAVPGTYSLVVRNFPSGNSYAVTYQQNIGYSNEWHTVTIPGPTSGGWLIDSTAALRIIFAMACGTTGIAPSANNWVTGNYIAAPGQINAAAAASNLLRISGVIVLPGTQAPTAAQSPYIMRPFDQELALCKRYYEKSYNYAHLPGAITTLGIFSHLIYGGAGFGTMSTVGGRVHFKVPKRAVPTVTFYNPSTGTVGQLHDAYSGAHVASTAGSIGENDCGYAITVNTSNGMQTQGHFVADARV